MVLAFGGFMVRRRRIQKEEAGMMKFDPIETANQESSSWGWVNDSEQNQDNTHDGNVEKGAPLSDRSSVRKAHTKDVAHIDVGDLPGYLPEDASYIEQDIDELAKELGGTSLPKQLAKSMSTTTGSSVRSFMADELQFSYRESGSTALSSTEVCEHDSQSFAEAAGDDSEALNLERHPAQADGQEMRVQQVGTPEMYTLVSRSNRASERKAHTALVSPPDSAEAAIHKAETRQGFASKLSSKVFAKSKSGSFSPVPAPRTSGAQGASVSATTGVARGDSVRSEGTDNAPSSITHEQSQSLAPDSFAADAISQTESFYDDVVADDGATTSSKKKKKKGSKKQPMEPSGSVEAAFSAEAVGYDAVEGQASAEMYTTVSRTADFDRTQMSQKSELARTATVAEFEGKEYAPLGAAQAAAASRGHHAGAAAHMVSKRQASQTAVVEELGDKEYDPLTPYQLAAAISASRDKSAQRAKATRHGQ
ncbi:uncharacterized protein LOC135827713 [Sycon ciliatum]|uniref:uncharacterized protein LOC135827713 n=1 Tax=Sycon ciliatum TaxID=27933 RepID=UPI0031F6E021